MAPKTTNKAVIGGFPIFCENDNSARLSSSVEFLKYIFYDNFILIISSHFQFFLKKLKAVLGKLDSKSWLNVRTFPPVIPSLEKW